jgi:hypothetical protein
MAIFGRVVIAYCRGCGSFRKGCDCYLREGGGCGPLGAGEGGGVRWFIKKMP